MPAWNGLQKVTSLRLSDYVVNAFLDAALPEDIRKAHAVPMTQEDA